MYLQLLCCWYILISISFLYSCIGTLGMMCALMQPSILYILTYRCCRSTVWSVNILFLLIIDFLKIPDGIFQTMLKFNDEEHYILMLIMCWSQLRSISYSIDNIETRVGNKYNDTFHVLKSYMHKLAYCLYLPTLSLGPLVLYQDFVGSVCIIFNQKHSSFHPSI